MPGGRIAPDGRAPQAKGVGKNSRRHDLEQPRTPGLHGSDLQQGDVQRLEAAQRVAPTPKRTQAAAAPQRTGGGGQRPTSASGRAVPDPIQFAAGRMGGKMPTASAPLRQVDASAWRPLVERMAYAPNSGGSLAANLTDMLTQFVRRPVVSEVSFVDLEGADRILGS